MNMPRVNPEAKPAAAAAPYPAKRSRRGRTFRWIAIVILAIVTLVSIANWLWLLSGSNQWQLKIDKDGVQVYTMKTPGLEALKVRVVSKSSEFSIGTHLAPVLDESVQQDCSKWVTGCLSLRIVQPWDPRTHTNIVMWTIAMPGPLSPREILVQNQITQDPKTKAVTLETLAMPNRLPPDDCCVRIEHLNNVWRYSPLPDGSIQEEMVYDMAMGGAFPQLLLNLGAPAQLFNEVSVANPAKLRDRRYRSAHLDFIDDSGFAAH
ncbi:hypothetical protein [Paraburkholderia humisilvae]|uniref:START domain-containing protein n=1 Tax=Paraburkholderia humisilvae TaxID=627669 RepID=A0A6J5EKS6_9BURK|nr:hypothetical protein [Paraburkholderia humisilvae]CAB3765842.1 hypothetical protein LMG29542_05245 [Paraburkholderia humisilvae]